MIGDPVNMSFKSLIEIIVPSGISTTGGSSYVLLHEMVKPRKVEWLNSESNFSY